MNQIWGGVLIIFGSLAWLGQAISFLLPNTAQRLSLTEPEAEVDPTFWADIRGEALWDSLTLWNLPVAGILLLLNNSLWIYFGLVGGEIYLYFSGRGILVRVEMRRQSIQIGTPKAVAEAYTFLSIWALIAAVTIAMAAFSL